MTPVFPATFVRVRPFSFIVFSDPFRCNPGTYPYFPYKSTDGLISLARFPVNFHPAKRKRRPRRGACGGCAYTIPASGPPVPAREQSKRTARGMKAYSAYSCRCAGDHCKTGKMLHRTGMSSSGPADMGTDQKRTAGRQQNRLYFCGITCYTFPEGKGVEGPLCLFFSGEVFLCMRNAVCSESGRL